MLYLPMEQNRFSTESMTSSRKYKTTAYKIDNGMLHDVLDQIYNDPDPYPYVKQLKSKHDGRRAFYVIHTRWLGPNHVNVKASEAEAFLQTSKDDGKKKV